MRHEISRSIFGARLQLWLSTATLAAVGIGSSALAQERPVPAPAPAPTDANAEGTIVVVGNRSRATTALESPVPIDVIDESQLATLGANSSLRDALGVLLPSFNSLTVSSSSWNSVARPASAAAATAKMRSQRTP